MPTPGQPATRFPGRFGSDDIDADPGKDGVTLSMMGDEDAVYSDLDPETALKLGEWLIAQAIALGVGHRTPAHEETRHG